MSPRKSYAPGARAGLSTPASLRAARGSGIHGAKRRFGMRLLERSPEPLVLGQDAAGVLEARILRGAVVELQAALEAAHARDVLLEDPGAHVDVAHRVEHRGFAAVRLQL